MVQRSASPESVNFFHIDAGRISGPAPFAIQSVEHTKSQSMGITRAGSPRLVSRANCKPDARNHGAPGAIEALASPEQPRRRRSFFTDEKGALPMRRLVRGIARVYRGEKSEENPPEVINTSTAIT